jgi:hypothetical protein
LDRRLEVGKYGGKVSTAPKNKMICDVEISVQITSQVTTVLSCYYTVTIRLYSEKRSNSLKLRFNKQEDIILLVASAFSQVRRLIRSKL